MSISAVLGCAGYRTLRGVVRMLLGPWPSRAVEPDAKLWGFEWYPMAKGGSPFLSLFDMLSDNCTREFGAQQGDLGC